MRNLPSQYLWENEILINSWTQKFSSKFVIMNAENLHLLKSLKKKEKKIINWRKNWIKVNHRFLEINKAKAINTNINLHSPDWLINYEINMKQNKTKIKSYN